MSTGSSSAGGGDTGETLEQLREQLRQETERANREAERANRENNIFHGTYFATLLDVWGVQMKAIEKKDNHHFAILLRESSPCFVERRRAPSDQQQQNQEQQQNQHDQEQQQQGPQQEQQPLGQYETKVAALGGTALEIRRGTNATVPLPLLVPAIGEGNSQKSSESTSSKKQIWPTDIFGQIDPIAEIAHLVPASASNASIFTDVARCVFAFRNDRHDTDGSILQKLIHGSKKPNDGPTGRSSRISHTGLKHCVANKIRLHGQGTYFDRYPCVLIVPVLTLEEAKQWNGEGYSAIVLAGPYNSTNAAEVISAANAYRTIQLNDGDEAEDDHIETGRVFLCQLVLGMMYSLKFRHGILEQGLDVDIKNRQQALRGKLLDDDIKIPRQKTHTLEQQTRSPVRMVSFSSHGVTVGHPAPDPLLLGVKAAINWSRNNNQNMMAAAEPRELDEDDEMDLQAEKEYLEWRAHLQLERRDKEIIGMSIGGCDENRTSMPVPVE